MPKKTTRLDLLLVQRGLLPSRQAAQAAIMDGGVLVNGKKTDKPGTPVGEDAELQLVGGWQGSKYVSRGGLKLEKALQQFEISVRDRVCIDFGASTGGFTDCLLQHGARQVYAVDVGYGQLDWKLRQDERVIVKERINARHLTTQELYGGASQAADLAVIDVSFISVTKILPVCITVLSKPFDIIALVKPQFEAGKQAVRKGGVVREAATHVQVLNEVISFCRLSDLPPSAVTYSPLKGPAGNMEFLLHAKSESPGMGADFDVDEIVAEAHRELNKE